MLTGLRRFAKDSPKTAALACVLLLAAVLGIGYWQQRRPILVAVGIDLPLVPGAAVDPTDRHSADLYLEEHPHSRIRVVNHLNAPDPNTGPTSIAALKNQGVRFFITTQASSHAVPSLSQFEDGSALAINVSATSNRLSDRDDHFLRIIPDLTQEQQAIARQINTMPGRRLLVLQDTGNRAYTDPAFQVFQAELARAGRWQVNRKEIHLTRFSLQRERQILEGQYDILYILGGGFVPVIGNIAQLFHTIHPQAPILLTPWARSPAILESAGPAAEQILIASIFPPRNQDSRVDRYISRFQQRFGYQPYAMGMSTRKALELLDRALASGASSPDAVKRFLLSKSEHSTSLGPVRFNRHGDVEERFYFFKPSAKALP